MKTKTALYYHGGSKNHGCEAIVRSTVKILNGNDIKVFSFSAPEDKLFGIDKIADVLQLGPVALHGKYRLSGIKQMLPKKILKILAKIKNSIIKPPQTDYAALYKDLTEQTEADVFMSIGGDNYCYDSYEGLKVINARLNKQGKKTVLWGCSVEPESIKKDAALRADLNLYSLITARESLTYNALIEAGISKNTQLLPDPAFALDSEEFDTIGSFKAGNTVGINISPMVQNLEHSDGMVFKSTVKLIEHILKETDMDIALIPHVIWEYTNDEEPLLELYNLFKGSGRVFFLHGNRNCMALKGIIAKCRFMIAARTHASIAAYSSCVPTLVIGYSVKSRGIAQDLFGQWQNYVLPVQDIKDEKDMIKSFKFIMQNEQKIKDTYKELMPAYIAKAKQAKEEVLKLLN